MVPPKLFYTKSLQNNCLYSFPFACPTLNLIQSVFSLHHSIHLHVSKSSEHISGLILFDFSLALDLNTSFFLTLPSLWTPQCQDFLGFLLTPLSLHFCLICRIFVIQRALTIGISEDIALAIISLHFHPCPWFQMTSIYRCVTKFNLSPRSLSSSSIISLRDPSRSTWPGLNPWSMLISQACHPVAKGRRRDE